MTNPHKGRTGLSRLRYAIGYSIEGLTTAYQQESAFRQETWMAVTLIPASFWIGQNWLEILVLAGSICLVMIVELLNSAIEATVDRVSYELHDLAKRAKDFGSAAVFLALGLSISIWGTVISLNHIRLYSDIVRLVGLT